MRSTPALVLLAAAACGSDRAHGLADGGGGPADTARPADASRDGLAGDASRLDGPRLDGALDAGPPCSADHCCTPADCQGGDAGSGAAFTCEDRVCVDVAGNLSGLLWSLPCTGAHNSTSCAAAATVTASATVGGHAGTTYDVSAHLRGIVEKRTYATSCADGSAVIGGDAGTGDPFNIYELDVSAPPQRIFVNPGTSGINTTFAIDYTLVFRADAGATITLQANSIDAGEIFNHDGSGAPIVIAGVSVAQPFDGQFIEMDVESVVPDAIDSGATVGAGSAGTALQLSGAEDATVLDAVSLEPADVTIEAWFQAAGTPGSYNSIVNKVFGTGSTDTYALWFDSGFFRTGVNLGSPSGAATTAFAPVDGAWHHIAGTFDHAAGIATLYIDGAPVACAPEAGPITYDTHPVLIGGDVDNGTPSGFWDGLLDEVRIFAVPRTAAQIWADMHAHQLGPTVGLVGEWTFDEGSGQTAADSSGTGNGAVLGATTAVEASDPTWVVSTVPH